MRVELFDFTLPQERIALRPAQPRGAARMLVVRQGEPFADAAVADFANLLQPGDALVVNDTRVIPARLAGIRRRGAASARIEAMLHQRIAPDAWRAFVRPAKRLSIGEAVSFAGSDGLDAIEAQVLEKADGGEIVFRFSEHGAALDAAIARIGVLPLPPYIAARRAADEADAADYQTMFARKRGAVAAPTAGLHFTPALAAAAAARGATLHHVTLHVGAGTFLPVKADDTADHRMHAETGRIDAATAAALNAARAAGGRIIAIGTTALRLLESAVDDDGGVRAFDGDTSIFITPGYRFRVVDALFTNFHLPRSTLFMLVCAFAGVETMRSAYAHAIAADYRFYSYGDASLLFPHREAA